MEDSEEGSEESEKVPRLTSLNYTACLQTRLDILSVLKKINIEFFRLSALAGNGRQHVQQ